MIKKYHWKQLIGTTKSIDIKIPSGIQNHEKIKLTGQGRKGENGGKNGDLIIKVNIQDDNDFKLIGYDLYTYLSITPWEAVLGAKVSISSIDEQITVIVPKGTQSGELLRIPGKGYKNLKGSRGDLVAEVKIVVPVDLDEEEERLFKELSEVSKFNPRKSY